MSWKDADILLSEIEIKNIKSEMSNFREYVSGKTCKQHVKGYFC